MPPTVRRRTSNDVSIGYYPSIRSRHPSHNVLRATRHNLPKFPFRVIVRFGSTTVATIPAALEINSIESIRRSSNKRVMKECFDRVNARTAEWFNANNETTLLREANRLTNHWERKLVCKNHYGSKGTGNTLVSSEAELIAWTRGKTLSNYIFERFMNFSHEFRLHITSEGCFYTCRKAMRENTPENERWHFHDSTCVWLLETNPRFFRPNTWNEIVRDCKAALREIGADVLSFDVKVQAPTDSQGRNREYQDYIILECNSASSMGEYDGRPSVCAQKYIDELPRIIVNKAINQNLHYTV